MTHSSQDLLALFTEHLSPALDALEKLGVVGCAIIKSREGDDSMSVIATSDGVHASGAAEMCEAMAAGLRERSVVRTEKRGMA